MAITDIEDKISEIIDKNDKNNFIYDFLGVYDIPKATVTKLRKGINNLADDPNEVYLKNKLYYKQTDGNPMQAFSDVKNKVDELGSKPRYILVTDFKEVLAYDTKTKDTLSVPFERLPQKFEFFLAWNGIEKADFDKENPADVRAAERFAKLFDVIVKDNPNASRKGLNLFFIRVLFCLFAEDTDIFKKNLFTNRIKELTKPDGSDLNSFIKELFSILDVKSNERSTELPSYLADFPYVDGDLFKDDPEDLKFTAKSRKLIIDAGEKLEWDQINPDILGSMLQAVASEDSRSHLGMHYTSVPNIMKVIKPLFLDNLREEFEKDKGNYKKLQHLYDRIGHIKFMDPACGSGNFLIVTYKQLRQLEIDILKEQDRILAEEGTGKAMMYLPSVTLDQFYGIEIDDFACDTTRLSLWIAEHQMNIKLRKEIHNAVRPTLPLQHAGAIVCGNALRLNWERILPHKKDDEVYLFGNPPYLGAKKQNNIQKEDLHIALSNNKKYKKLDYISGWFQKASEYIENSSSKSGFVTTNSITQGEQVNMLWPSLLQKVNINFAYSSFKWRNNAKGNAGVIVNIIGMCAKDINTQFYLFNGNNFKKVKHISPYLVEGNATTIATSRHNLNPNMPIASLGCLPLDGGHLILSPTEYKSVISKYSNLKSVLKKYIGSKEFINGKNRYVIWLDKNDYIKYKDNPFISQRINLVKKFRQNGGQSAQESIETSYKFFTRQLRDTSIKNYHKSYPSKTMLSIIIPRVSSQNRYYVPMGIVDENTIISDSATAIYGATLWLLGLLESRMHMIWLKAVGGRLKNDFRYSAGLVYNTFPIPKLSSRRKNEIEQLILNILDIREEEEGTLADLYGSPLAQKNPKPMNPRLLKAHQELDEVVDRAYRSTGFKDDNERLAVLLDMYSKKVHEENEG